MKKGTLVLRVPFGGVGEIRTHGRLITVTRFPVVLVMTTSILLRVHSANYNVRYYSRFISKMQVFFENFFMFFSYSS